MFKTNKGVITLIEKDENMPYCPETGERAEILLNPLGIKYAQLKSL